MESKRRVLTISVEDGRAQMTQFCNCSFNFILWECLSCPVLLLSCFAAMPAHSILHPRSITPSQTFLLSLQFFLLISHIQFHSSKILQRSNPIKLEVPILFQEKQKLLKTDTFFNVKFVRALTLSELRGEQNNRKSNIRIEPNRNFEIRFGFFGFSIRFGFKNTKISVFRFSSVWAKKKTKKPKNRIIF